MLDAAAAQAALGYVDTTEVTAVAPDTAASTLEMHCFDVVTAGRTYHLAADTVADRDLWMEAIEARMPGGASAGQEGPTNVCF